MENQETLNNFPDTGSEVGSVAEEQLRVLFEACDIDGDGFIDR